MTEEVVYSTPFATLLHFKKATGAPRPRVSLGRADVRPFRDAFERDGQDDAADHDVYITDWHNVRDVPLAEGGFDFGAFVDHLIEFLRVMGAWSHVVAVCQPCVAVLAAVSFMAEDGDAAQPRSMTLMAGPIDTRVNPTKVNQLAVDEPIEWFEKNLIADVPPPL